MSRPPITFQRTYVDLFTTDLRKTYIRDTVVIDDTGAIGPTTQVILPKIGTAYAPVGRRVTFKKSSTVPFAIELVPDTPDGISAPGSMAFPSIVAGAGNASLLPPGVVNSVTLEATDMALVGAAQPNPFGGTPTTPGAWLAVQSLPNGGVSVESVTAGDGLGNSGTASNPILDIQVNIDGSISLAADSIGVGVLASDTQHGLRGGGTQHFPATTVAAGFQSALDKVRQNQTQGGMGVTLIGTGTALITPPIPFDPSGAINITKSGAAGATTSVTLQITAVDGGGLNFTVTSVDAAGAAVLEAVSFRWSTTPV